MKRILVAVMLLASYTGTYSQACCCSSAGGSYSILPNLDKHVVGIRYSYADYNTTIYPAMNMTMANGDLMSMSGTGKAALERMNTLDVFGRFSLPKRFHISVFLPVHILSEKSESGVQRSAGIGDLSLLLQYSVFDPAKCNGEKSKHQLKLGAGVKAPTGKFEMTPDGMFNTDLQMGTGSVDFLFNATYTYRYEKFGFNIFSAYKKDLVNKQQFRFGDKLREGVNAFYVLRPVKDITLTPTAGLNYDHAFFNFYQKQKLTYTGGDYISASAGLDIYYKQFALSTSVSPMLMSWLNWSGEPIQRLTFEAGFYYSF
ncbi:MAG: hypothetical protein JWO06_1793 [Bacteroidota bacterium]|nr:hypothetical protein [Bacteroidota bacterium]